MPRAVDHGSGVSSRIGAWEGSPRRPQIDPALRPFPSQMLVDRARVSVPESWAIGPSPIRLPRNAARHNAGIQEWGIHDARSPHPPQRSMLVIVDPGNGCPRTIRYGRSRRPPAQEFPAQEGAATSVYGRRSRQPVRGLRRGAPEARHVGQRLPRGWLAPFATGVQ